MVDASETPLRLGVRRATAQSHSSAMPVPYRLFCLLTTRRTGRTLFTLSLIPCWRPSARCTVALPEGQRRARSAAASANPPPVGTRRHVAVAHVLDFDIFTRNRGVDGSQRRIRGGRHRDGPSPPDVRPARRYRGIGWPSGLRLRNAEAAISSFETNRFLRPFLMRLWAAYREIDGHESSRVALDTSKIRYSSPTSQSPSKACCHSAWGPNASPSNCR